MRSSTTVKDLAQEADYDIDDVLLTLWDHELTRVEGPDDLIFDREVSLARRALGLPATREIVAKSYWCERLGIIPSELDALLVHMGFESPAGRSRIPKGSVNKLRAEARLKQASDAKKSGPRSPVHAKTMERPIPRDWVVSGHQLRDMRYLTEEEVVGIHFAIAKESQPGPDPIFPTGVRDWALLGSAVGRPLTSMAEAAKYPTIEMAAAALLHSVVLDHAFHNGNKRTGLVAMLVFLDANGVLPTCSQDEALRFVLRLAKHGLTPFEGYERSDQEVLAATEWVLAHSRLIDKSERPLQWRELKHALAEYDCTWEFRGRDNCLRITRRVKRSARYFGQRDRFEELHVQATFMGEGGELTKREVAGIRRALELDETDGIDSQHFYSESGLRVDAWINRYRLTLKRLARL